MPRIAKPKQKPSYPFVLDALEPLCGIAEYLIGNKTEILLTNRPIKTLFTRKEK